MSRREPGGVVSRVIQRAAAASTRMPRDALGQRTTACRTSSVLLSAPDLDVFLPLAELPLFFPLLDMSILCLGVGGGKMALYGK